MNTLRMKRSRKVFVCFVFAVAICAAFILAACSSDRTDTDGEAADGDPIRVYDNTVEYDGLPHGITVDGLSDGDTVVYSADGVEWTHSLTYTEPGSYDIACKIVHAGKTQILYGRLVITYTRLTDISAPDVELIYTGSAQSAGIAVRDGDTVVYTVDGVLAAPEFTDVGVYTVGYELARPGVGYSNGEYTVTVLPDLSGTYVAADGIVTVSGKTMRYGGTSHAISYGVDGTGKITGLGTAFTAVDGVLTIDGGAYTVVGADDSVYELTVGERTVYAAGGTNLRFDIRFGTGAAIYAGGRLITTLAGYNYCENVVGGTLERALPDTDVGFVADGTQVSVALSARPTQSGIATELNVFYNGAPHQVAIDGDGTVLYLHDGGYTAEPYSFTEPGEHRYGVLVLSDTYLPFTAECVVTVYPVIDGTYYDSHGYITIDRYTATVNGIAAEYAPTATGGMLSGTPISVALGELDCGGRIYTLASGALLIAGDDVLPLNSDSYTLTVSDRVTLTDDDTGASTELSVSPDITVTVGGSPLFGVPTASGTEYHIVSHDLTVGTIVRIN